MTAEELLDKGTDYLYGFGDVDKDYEQAMNHFVKALDAGSVKAMNEIGFMYQYGYGVLKNKSEAVKWYRRGAELGDTDSMNSLADCLLKGLGTDKNVDEAVKLYTKAAELGNFNRVQELATCLIKYFGDESTAYKWLKKSCDNASLFGILQKNSSDNKDLKFMDTLADIYYFSMPDTPENKLKAFKWCEKMAQRDPRCGYYLATMYWNGEGVEKNLDKAFKLFKQSADLGNTQSMSELAEIYLKGELVPKDESKALEWITKSFEKNAADYELFYDGDEKFNAKFEALYNLANIYYADEDYAPNCDKSLEDKKRAFEIFQQLDELGFSHARYRIARMYERGEYVAKDTAKALELYKSKADTESEHCRKVVELYLEGGNIPDAARFIVKYFDTAEEQFCKCPLCSPFEETKKVAKFFIDTPNEEIIKLYDNDKMKAAQEVFDFGQACRESSVNLGIHLEVISKSADILGEDSPRKILEYLAECYTQIYTDSIEDGVPDSVEGDALENLLGDLTKSFVNYAEENKDNFPDGDFSVEYEGEETEFEHHDAEYYKMRAEYYRLKLKD